MSNLYQHFRPEEKEFVDQAINWRQQVEDQYAPKLTDFLDPRQQFILRSVIGEDEQVKIRFEGGSEVCERKRALLFPEYLAPETKDFQISLLELIYPQKFIQIDHRQVLGSIMSLGLKREKFGDIMMKDGKIQLYCAEEIKEYMIRELQHVGKAKVTLEQRLYSEAIVSDEQWIEKETTASSLRLDVIIAAALNLSRQKSQAIIQSGKAKLNWEQVENPSVECRQGDVISARGFGRIKLMELSGMTKKEKWRVTIGLLK